MEDTTWGHLTSSVCRFSRRNDKNDDARISGENIFDVVEYIGTMFAILLLASLALMTLIYFFMPPVGLCDCSDREEQPEPETECVTENEITYAETELSVRFEDTETEIMEGETDIATDIEIPLDGDYTSEIHQEWHPSESLMTTDDIKEMPL